MIRLRVQHASMAGALQPEVRLPVEPMSRSRNLFVLGPLSAMLFLASCKGAEQVCNPTDPLCGGGGGATVADVTITSPVDTVMAVGRTAAMSAIARDASSNPVTTTFNWSSTVTSVATVNSSSGLVTALAAGVTQIEARQNLNTVFGEHVIRAVNADLPAVTALVSDVFAVRLRQALSTTPQGQVGGLLTVCAGQVTSGHVRALDTCLTNLTSVSGGTNGNDNALLNVLDLFFAHARRQLQL